MNELDRAYADALFEKTVADRECVRAAVLARAHAGEAGPDADAPAAVSPAAPSRTVPFAPPRRRHWARFVSVPVAACAAFFVLVNVSAPFAAAVEKVPVLGDVARLITVRRWESDDESAAIRGQQPAVEGTGNAAFETETNALIQEKLDALDAKAKADAAEYRENWLAMGNASADFTPIRYTFDYETYSTGDVLSFRIRQQKTVTTNTEDTYTTLFYYNLDPATGEAVTLADLLGEDWKDAVARSVDEQLRASGDENRIAYYEEFWVGKNVPIDETLQFYVDGDGAVHVVFDEGWIAPYEAGPQTFAVSRP